MMRAAVTALRKFEAAYRANLTNHLRSQIESLETGRSEPVDAPDVIRDLRPVESSTNGAGSGADSDTAPAQGEQADAPTLGGGSPTSNTPRLDALLGDQR